MGIGKFPLLKPAGAGGIAVPRIILHTSIAASQKVCFELSTSIDLHKISTADTNEEAIAGTTTGMIKLNQYVTWRARHFGIWFKLSTKITTYEPFNSFTDEMISGNFKCMKHLHAFGTTNTGTLMTDDFYFESPYGFIGKIVDRLILKRYLTNLLIKRNNTIKHYAESDKWMQLV
jgi:ligand-binding SRPBCC domain-containing protein